MALLVYLCIALCMPVLGQTPVTRLCADPECKEPISSASVYLTYSADDERKLSVQRGDTVYVYSKEIGSDLWEVMIVKDGKVGGKRGYLAQSLMKEGHIFKSKDKLVEVSSENKSSKIETFEENVANSVLDKDVPDSGLISESFAVVDGTTFYSDTPDSTSETEPMETAYTESTVVKPLTHQFSRTIDATSLSKSKLDEPNDSLIIPQPTTSSDVKYGESSQTVTPALPSHEGVLESEGIVKGSDLTVGNFDNSSVTESAEVTNTESVENLDKSVGDETEIVGNKIEEEYSDEEEEEEDEGEELEEDGEEEEEEDEEEREEEDVEVSGEIDNVVEVGSDSRKSNEGTEVKSEMEGDLVSGNGSTASETDVVLESSASSPSHDSYVEDLTEERQVGSVQTGDSQEKVTNTPMEEKMSSVSLLLDNKVEQKDTENIPPQEYEVPLPDVISSTGKDLVQAEENSSGMNVNEQEQEASTFPEETENSVGKYESQSPLENNYLEDNSAQIVENRDIPEHLYSSEGSEKQFVEREGSLFGEGVQNDNSSDMALGEQENEVSNSDPTVPAVDSNVNQESGGSESSVLTSGGEDELQSGSSAETMQFSSEESKEKVSTHVEVGEQTNEESVNTLSLAHFISSGYRSMISMVMGSQEAELDPFDNSGMAEIEISMKNENVPQEEISGSCKVHTPGCEPESGSLPAQQLAASQAELHSSSQDFKRSDVIMELDKSSFDTVLYLIVTAVTVLIFSLGHYYIEKKRRDGSLIAKINTLEKALMVSSQEKFELRDELEKLTSYRRLSDAKNIDSDLLQELEESKAARFELEEQIASLEKELEGATEAGLELNRMMSELLSAQHGSDTLMKSVEHLQKQLDSQQGTISTMNACLTAKNLENETLQSELNLALQQINSLKEELENASQTLSKAEKERTEMEQSLVVKNQAIEQKLVEALESKSADSQRLCRELDALQDVLDETRRTLLAREGEVAVLRDILNNSENMGGGDHQAVSFEELLDVGNLRAKCELLSQECDNLKERLRGEEDARKLLEDHVKIVSEEVSTLRTKYEEADREKVEAQTRLEVLSNYFKEKETQLQKELGLQEAMCLQKEGDVLSTIERIKLFQEEIESYKAQNELLKKEILDQERSLKAQIVALEKKVHENWVAARQAERRLEESKQEASQLRNRLTLKGRRVVGTMPGPDAKPEREVELNGEVPSSPALMNETQEIPSSPLHYGLPASPPLLPPSGQPIPTNPFHHMGPPPMFLPPGVPPFPMPPPGGFFHDDLRPPPLGRMSSPPPEPRGSFSPYDHSPPRSSPNRPYRSPVHYDDPPGRFRHQSPPSSGAPPFSGPYPPAKWDDRAGPSRSSFRPLHRDREQKEQASLGRNSHGRHNSEAGSALSSGHSSDSLEKGGHHSSRV